MFVIKEKYGVPRNRRNKYIVYDVPKDVFSSLEMLLVCSVPEPVAACNITIVIAFKYCI